jgi:hypothetical protein
MQPRTAVEKLDEQVRGYPEFPDMPGAEEIFRIGRRGAAQNPAEIIAAHADQ